MSPLHPFTPSPAHPHPPTASPSNELPSNLSPRRVSHELHFKNKLSEFSRTDHPRNETLIFSVSFQKVLSTQEFAPPHVFNLPTLATAHCPPPTAATLRSTHQTRLSITFFECIQ